MFSENPQVESRSCTPWTKYHYALLTCKGVSFLFDTLRYEDAFPCRKADVEALKRSMKGLEAVLDDFTLLICKYGEGRPIGPSPGSCPRSGSKCCPTPRSWRWTLTSAPQAWQPAQV